MKKMHRFILLLLCSTLVRSVHADTPQNEPLDIGDPAPPLKVARWIKGTPITEFEKGQIYVLDFWATWCTPCKVSMPYLSGLTGKFKNKVTFLAIDVWEHRTGVTTPTARINEFVQSMGNKMNFPVATDDHNFMARQWLKASESPGIPQDFIINADGKIAWIGNPAFLDSVLSQVVNHNWDIEKAADKRAFHQHIKKLNTEFLQKLPPDSEWTKLDLQTQADSTLSIVNRMILQEPDSKYGVAVIYKKFRALLIHDPEQAYTYGKWVTHHAIDPRHSFQSLIRNIKSPPDGTSLPGYIYYLGAQTYQKLFESIPEIYRNAAATARMYQNMATWYRLAYEKTLLNQSGPKTGDSSMIQDLNHKKSQKSSHSKSGLGAPPPPPPPPVPARPY